MDNSIVIFDEPAEEHVHETSGKYELRTDFALTEAVGVTANSDWVLEAKVWGHEDGLAEVEKSIEFHVHPE